MIRSRSSRHLLSTVSLFDDTENYKNEYAVKVVNGEEYCLVYGDMEVMNELEKLNAEGTTILLRRKGSPERKRKDS